MKDKLGREIKIGDYIVYGSLLGQSAALRIGKVLALKEDPTRITVWGVEDGVDLPHYKKQAKLVYAKGHLSFPERVIVLRSQDVPRQYLTLLEPVTLDRKNSSWYAEYKKRNPE